MNTNTHEISCSIVRVWKGAHDVCLDEKSWNDAVDILEVAFDEINSLIYKIEMFNHHWEKRKSPVRS